MLNGEYYLLFEKLQEFITPNRLIHDEMNLLAHSTDASFYRLIPKLIVKLDNLNELTKTLILTNQFKLPVTFRAAGTSLSGQAISDSVLLIITNKWNNFQLLDNVNKISLQPGLIGSYVNKILLPYKKKIGPDPASINSAMIGGIAANNASGMCCGTAQNSYKTLSSMKIVFHDGTLLDTSDLESRNEFLIKKKELIGPIRNLHSKINSDSILKDRINHKFKMKNTTGYSLNAFTDFDDPIDIIQHLMIGSEGTLGFIAEITFQTVDEFADKASSLIIFPSIEEASRGVAILKQCDVDAVELMDRAALRSVENKKGMPSYLIDLDNNCAGLLVETRAKNKELLQSQIETITNSLTSLSTTLPIVFTDIPTEYSKLWNIRKGLFPSVGAMRKSGTTCIIEDVAFPVPMLADAVIDLQNLFKMYSYDDAIVFGHALEGNLHFVFNQDFNSESEVARYSNFMNELTHMVVTKYDGSLKAEHGTGRNMAPFVELEWGTQAYELMKEIKNIFDPENLLNPGVVINNDKNIHLKNLKPLPTVNPIIDKCIECGFCEVNCVSADLTLSPRERIVVLREIARMEGKSEEKFRLSTFSESMDYSVNQTCATDGLCAIACPVGIDTGNMIKNIRYNENSKFAKSFAMLLAKNMNSVTSIARISLNFVHYIHKFLDSDLMEYLTISVRRLSLGKIPLWNKFIPKGAEPIKLLSTKTSTYKVVYFPSCINRSMGISIDYGNEVPLINKTISLLEKAGYEIIFPANLDNLCCGMAFSSKGFKEAGDLKSKELEEELMKVTENGKIPVLCDMSPCLHRMRETLDKRLMLFEPIEFIADYLLDKLEFTKIEETISFFQTCSTKKMEIDKKLKLVLDKCVTKVIDIESNCCGFAGDRGFTYPELNENGLSNIKSQIKDDCKNGYSNSRTCEIGLTLHSGISFKSIVYLVDNCTKRKEIISNEKFTSN
ncbi:MAG: FAD-binding and (Fe-S)-binding domain-containing protein [Ignavibacteria bacterium]|nr:FAD-binding and (Fe-S)-binding domain-containing protein [Ignavibacteria bacterium]